jgi:predicted ATPase/DNA-binding CsgD family transcriptional regulator
VVQFDLYPYWKNVSMAQSTANRTIQQTPGSLLPLPLTPLIGREAALAEILSRLGQTQVRLISLTGPPGVGKTRLGLQAAHEVQLDFTDGVYFVALASIQDPDLVVPTIAQTLGLPQEGERQPLDRLRAFLPDKQLLLVLDNFEQVVAAAPALVDLLALGPGLKMLVTSRAALRLRGEYEIAVSPLAVPDLERLSGVTGLAEYAAVSLFVERAQSIKPDFQLTTANAPHVAEICARLDGLPLALELAAARIKLLSPQTILARLERRMELLAGGPVDLPARQQTLRQTLDWSYNLLTPDEQRLFRRLAVFVGGCTLAGAEAVAHAAGEPALEVINTAALLIDKSLIRQIEPAGNEPRLVMLESIHDYALDQLAANQEETAVRRSHLSYYVDLAETAEAGLNGPAQPYWLNRLEVEHGNLRAALRQALAQDELGQFLRLAGAVWQFWFLRGYMSEGQRWLEAGLAKAQAVTAAVRAKAYGGAGVLAAYLGNYRQAKFFSEQSLTASQALDFKPGIAGALNTLAFIAGMQGDHANARAFGQESVAICRALDNRPELARALNFAAIAAWLRGDYPAAQALVEEGLTLARLLDDQQRVASFLYGLGLVTVAQGRFISARPYFAEALATLRALGDKRSITMCLAGLADIALSQNDTTTACTLAQEALLILNEVGDRWFAAYSLDGLAVALTVEGDMDRAARFFGAATGLRQALGAALPVPRQPAYDRYLPIVQARLDQPSFNAAWAEGQAMTLEQLVAAGIGRPPAVAPPADPPLSPRLLLDDLTSREIEILRLVAQGLTNVQVADKLVISRHTVHTHLSSIYGKLGVTSRMAAVRYAADHHLI